MTPLHAVMIAAVGFAAGAINAVIGSGGLITFPTLLFLGYSPLVANVTNTVGLVFGSISGTVGYRRELTGQAGRAKILGIPAALGAAAGACLLLILPARVFQGVVPVLVAVAVVLVVIQPSITQRVRPHPDHAWGRRWLQATVFLTGIYGGYFGAAQGVILMGLLGLFIDESLQRLNGIKNVIAMIVNTVAAVIFVTAAPVYLPAAGLLAVGGIAGGQAGAWVARRLSPTALRAIIVIGGVAVVVRMLA